MPQAVCLGELFNLIALTAEHLISTLWGILKNFVAHCSEPENTNSRDLIFPIDFLSPSAKEGSPIYSGGYFYGLNFVIIVEI